VKLLLSLADGFVAKGNMHANNIRGWCAAVDKRYKEFSVRMEKYRTRLEETLGVHQVEEVSIVKTDCPSKMSNNVLLCHGFLYERERERG
jgi:hypothetical protein